MSGWIICTPDMTPVVEESDCPRAELHTPMPRGYIAWFDWAASMNSKGKRSSRCPGCRLYKVWS